MNSATTNTTTSASSPVLFVTGASRGIGAATARQAAAAGWHVAINYVNDERAAQTVAADVRAAGQQALVLQGDVQHEADVLAMFAAIDTHFGRLDGLVNNAGVVDQPSRVADMSAARLARMLGINVMGSLLCAREAVRRMSTRREHGFAGTGGVIVNLSSAAAKLGSPGQYVDYASAKGAIDSFTLGLAREVAAEGIRVNGVRPGIIDTDIHASGGIPDRAAQLAPSVPMQRAGSADEVAQAVLWLLGEGSSYTTGATIDVTGGR